jgi:hypothetical protein
MEIKSSRMRWVEHVARMGEERKVFRALVGKRGGKDHPEDRGVNGRMGSEWILGRLAEGLLSGYTWLRIGASGGLF